MAGGPRTAGAVAQVRAADRDSAHRPVPRQRRGFLLHRLPVASRRRLRVRVRRRLTRGVGPKGWGAGKPRETRGEAAMSTVVPVDEFISDEWYPGYAPAR